MKTALKQIALFMAFSMLMTSCYTTRVTTSNEKKNDITGYISTLESGDKIRITSHDLEKYKVQFLASDGSVIKGFDLNKSPSDHVKKIVSIEITSIQQIETINAGATALALTGGFLALTIIIGLIDIAINGINTGL